MTRDNLRPLAGISQNPKTIVIVAINNVPGFRKPLVYKRAIKIPLPIGTAEKKMEKKGYGCLFINGKINSSDQTTSTIILGTDLPCKMLISRRSILKCDMEYKYL